MPGGLDDVMIARLVKSRRESRSARALCIAERFRRAWILVLALLAMTVNPARAGWPMPAGGVSASGDPEVLFTFDDGPHPRHTADILDLLAERNIKAIFFWVGWRLERGDHTAVHRDLVHRAVREGHLVANHTVNHPNLCQVQEDEAAEEIDRNTRTLEDVIGLPILLFRAPYGASCQRLRRMLADRSLDHTHWDIDPQEWRHHNIKRTVNFVIKKLKRLDGRAIVLLHDTHRVTVRALPKILDWIEKENKRRLKTGKRRPIRIIGARDYLNERLDSAMLDWVTLSARNSAKRMYATLTRLIP